jgi:hypothetical protein
LFCFLFAFVGPPYWQRRGWSFFYIDWCSFTTPYSTWGYIIFFSLWGLSRIYIHLIHYLQNIAWHLVLIYTGNSLSAGLCSNLCLNLFNHQKWQSDIWTVVGLTAAKFKPLMFPMQGFSLSIARTFEFSWFRITSAGLLHNLVSQSQSQRYITTDGQSASLSWCQAPIWDLRSDFYSCQTGAVFLMWGALSDERTCLQLTIAAGPRQSIYSWVLVARDWWPYFTLSDSRLPKPGGPGPHIYIPQEQSSPVIPPGIGCPNLVSTNRLFLYM